MLDKKLLLTLLNYPQLVHDYYLDCGLNMYEELSKLCRCNKECTKLYLPKNSYNHCKKLSEICKLFPIQEIYLKPFRAKIVGTNREYDYWNYNWSYSEYRGVIPESLFNKIKNYTNTEDKHVYKTYRSMKTANLELNNAFQEWVYEQRNNETNA